ncbi:MAG: hypothetical protein F6K62_25345, partial [Sphaerospermopsis sp. SIO1G2]|nr:hypothetical protein [Sphaerospermopsis sp. SIO1G2]
MKRDWRAEVGQTQLPLEKLAIGSWVWGTDYYHGRFSLLDLPRQAAELGFQQIECNDFILPPPRLSRVTRPFYSLLPYANPDLWRYRSATLRTLKNELETHQKTCLCWAMNTDFAQPVLGQLASRLYWWWGARAVELLQPRMVRIIAGGDQKTVLNNHIVKRMAACVRYFLQRPSVQHVVLENHWGLSSTIDQHLQLYAQVNDQL